MNIAEASINKRTITLVFTFLLVVLGVWSYLQLPRLEDPEFTIKDALIITQPDLRSTAPAVISATIFNNGKTAETLDSITVPGTAKTAELKPAKGNGPLTIPAHGSLVIGGKGNASASLASGREASQDGNAQKVTFSFSTTGDVSLRAFVVPAESYFKKWGPTAVPTTAPAAPSPAKSASASPSGSASPATSSSPSVSATNSAAAQ